MRRGQLSLFIILGLVVLLVVGVALIAFRSGEPQTLTAQQETAVVTNLVQQCLAEAGESVTRSVLSQGGYFTFETLSVSPGLDSDIISFEPQTVPLWHETEPCADGLCIGDNRPQLCSDRTCPVETADSDVSWQDSIERGIEANIERCLNDFSSIATIVTVDGPPDVHALIRDDDVYIELELPLTLTTTDDQTVELDTFTATMDVDLEQLYQIATDIYVEERQRAFLEETFLHLLTTSSGIDSPIPPTKDVQLRGGMKYWVTQDVRNEVETGLMPFLGFLQVANAMESYRPLVNPYVAPEYEPYAAGIYDYLTIKLDERAYPLGVQFQYPYESMRLTINNEEFLKGREMPGSSFLNILGGMTFIEYRFRYDVEFPMIVKITDPYAFNGRGVDLFYGLEANIRNNEPVDTSRDIITVRSADSLVDLASPEQLVNHDYTVRVLDRRTRGPVADSGISYYCGTEFTVGATSTDGTWTGRLPYCAAGGVLVMESLDFVGTPVSLDNSEEDGLATTITIEAWPRQDKTVRLYKLSEDLPTPRQLAPEETAILTLSRVQESPYDPMVPFLGILEFGTTNTPEEKAETLRLLELALAQGDITQEEYDLAVAETQAAAVEEIETHTIDLVPGSYEITGFLTYYGLLQIPAQEECSGVFPLRNCVTLPAQNFTSWQSGGVILAGAEAVVFSEEFVYADRELVLYVLEQPIPGTWDTLRTTESLEDLMTYDRKQLVIPDR